MSLERTVQVNFNSVKKIFSVHVMFAQFNIPQSVYAARQIFGHRSAVYSVDARGFKGGSEPAGGKVGGQFFDSEILFRWRCAVSRLSLHQVLS